MYYIYEDSHELIEIAGIPIIYDYAFFAQYKDFVDQLTAGMPSNEWARLRTSYALSFDRNFRSCIYDDGVEASLNGLGYFLYERFLSSYHIKIHKDCNLFSLRPHEMDYPLSLIGKRICGFIESELKSGKSFEDIPAAENIHAKKAHLGGGWYYGRINGEDRLQLRIAYSFIPSGDNDFIIKIADSKEKRSNDDAVNFLKDRIKQLDRENRLSEEYFLDVYIPR
jgi:hypothetical protein